MKELLIEKLYDFWSKTDDDKETLLKEITRNVNDGTSGAEIRNGKGYGRKLWHL